jgi:thiol-disulfide isomerase/thioredoxin
MTSSFFRVALTCTSLLGLAACSQIANTQATQSALNTPVGYETYIKTGDLFSHAHFIDIYNNDVSLGKKKKLVILFATWCSDSQRLIKQLQQSSLSQDSQLQIIAIGREENTQSLLQFQQAYNISYSLIADPDRAIYNQYANKGVPRLILLDENNQVVKTLIGEDPNSLQKVRW